MSINVIFHVYLLLFLALNLIVATGATEKGAYIAWIIPESYKLCSPHTGKISKLTPCLF